MSKVVIKHPYIVQDKKICRGSPVISGTRTRVIDIVIEYEYLGYTPDKIIVAHPYLNLSQIHDALSYYYGHREKIDQEIRERKVQVEELRKHYQLKDK